MLHCEENVVHVPWDFLYAKRVTCKHRVFLSTSFFYRERVCTLKRGLSSIKVRVSFQCLASESLTSMRVPGNAYTMHSGVISYPGTP